MFSPEVIDEITAAARHLGIEAAALLAVAEVESGGVPYAKIKGRNEPLIRFEGHHFDRRLSEEKRQEARRKRLASPHAGAIRNPATQTGRWKLLEKAERIDHVAAFESVSWGLGQVMGAHWKLLGYEDVDALVAEARLSVGGQARLMARYIEKTGLLEAITCCDWAAFACGYNGPLYECNAYDSRMASAYEFYGGTTVPRKVMRRKPRLLASGMAGDDVRTLQKRLFELGFSVEADGLFGPRTAAALRQFQEKNGLPPDAIAGPLTCAALGLDSGQI